MTATIETKNRLGETGVKQIFDQGVMKYILMALDKAANIKQTQDGDIEE